MTADRVAEWEDPCLNLHTVKDCTVWPDGSRSWGAYGVYCARKQGHEGLHEGRDGTGLWERWEDGSTVTHVYYVEDAAKEEPADDH